MQFINPSFLYALGFLAIPILIHLFNFRRPKRLVFSDIRFLKQILQQNKKQRQLKHYFILLLRLLALSALIFAFANPYLPKGSSAAKSNAPVFIYIDNSFSMNAMGKDAELFEQAKNKARTVINAYGDSRSYQILTNNFESKHRINYNKKDVLNLLDEVKISNQSKSFNQILARQKSQSENGSIAYWIGDAQESQARLNDFQLDSNLSIRYLQLLPENSANVWVDSVWFTDPIVKKNQLFTIKVKIKNGSKIDIENQSVSLILDGNQKAIQTFSCKSSSNEIIDFPLQINDGNWHQASIKITDYPVSFDDEYFFTFKVSDEANILQIYEDNPNQAFSQLYQLDATYKLQKSQVRNLKYSDFNNYQLIIIDRLKTISSGLFNELERFAKDGGIVVVLPNLEQTGYNELSAIHGVNYGNLKTGNFLVNKVELNDPIFRGVFNNLNEQNSFPEINKSFELSVNSNSGIKSILQTNNSIHFLIRKSLGKGQFYWAANDLSSTSGNFSQHALFVPVFLQMPFQIKSKLSLSYSLGLNNLIPITGKNSNQLFKIFKAKEEWICETDNRDGNTFALLPTDLNEAGFFDLKDEKKEVIAKLALNFLRNESKLNYLTEEKLIEKGFKIAEANDAQLSLGISANENGVPLWRYFLIAAFVFFLIEMLLLWRRKIQ